MLSDGGRVLRPEVWHSPDRHILLGISHPSNDPARHRTFEVRAAYDAETGEWSARVGEQNLNEQRGEWGPDLADANCTRRFPTAAACLGDAVARLVAQVDQEAQEAP
jgi:hypothetical protein